MQLRILELKETDELVSHLQLIPIYVQNVPFLAFIIRHTFGLMVLSLLGRLVPALRRAFMLAYKPGFDLFICVFYHTPTAMPFVFLIHAQAASDRLGERRIQGAFSPLLCRLYFYMYYRSLSYLRCQCLWQYLCQRLESGLVGRIEAVVYHYLASVCQPLNVPINSPVRNFHLFCHSFDKIICYPRLNSHCF